MAGIQRRVFSLSFSGFKVLRTTIPVIDSDPYGHVRMYDPKNIRFCGESSVTSNTSCFRSVALIAASPCHFLYNMEHATFGTKGINIIYLRAKCSLANRNRGMHNKNRVLT